MKIELYIIDKKMSDKNEHVPKYITEYTSDNMFGVRMPEKHPKHQIQYIIEAKLLDKPEYNLSNEEVFEEICSTVEDKKSTFKDVLMKCVATLCIYSNIEIRIITTRMDLYNRFYHRILELIDKVAELGWYTNMSPLRPQGIRFIAKRENVTNFLDLVKGNMDDFMDMQHIIILK